MDLRPVYEFINSTALSQYLQASTYCFPVVEVAHLVGLTILLGAAIIFCLGLWGLGMQRPVSEVYEGLSTWTWLGMALVFGTGLILLVAEPMKMATNVAFPYKLAFLSAGLVLHFFGLVRLARPGKAEAAPVLGRVVAALVLLCWFGAGVAGRAIGFV